MYTCDKCGGTGKTPYLHISRGICFKCDGSGKLTYNPQARGDEAEAPEPNYDAMYDTYVEKQEREFWLSYDAQLDEVERQEFWEEHGFEAN
jgi:RecJ-like exonuclease